jgi:hypothetical protein
VPSGDQLDSDAGTGAGRDSDGCSTAALIRLSRGSSPAWCAAWRPAAVVFERQHAIVLGGTAGDGPELREGMVVGYDVGWTSHGLRVTKLFPVAATAGQSVTAADPSET